jgi:formylmethanofuran dehydrogenase subunit A
MFAYPRYVIKSGEVVVEEGEIRNVVEGRGFIVRPVSTRKSRTTFARCFSSITPCPSIITRWN